jgi:basic membrane protein A
VSIEENQGSGEGGDALPEWTVVVQPGGARPAGSEAADEPPQRIDLGRSASPTAATAAAQAATPVHTEPPQQLRQGLPSVAEPQVIERERSGGLGSAGLIALGVGVGLLLLLAVAALGFALSRSGNDGDQTAQAADDTVGAEDTAEDIRRLLTGIGYENVEVVDQDGTLFVSGNVETQADVAAVVTASASLADGQPINTDGLSVAAEPPAVEVDTSDAESDSGGSAAAQIDPLQRLQVDLNRTVAATPIIFEPGVAGISIWHTDTLDRVAETLLASPGIAVTLVGYTDGTGSSASNRALSEERAGSVRDYLIGKGLDPGLIRIDARGESDATGLRDIGYLERRVEVEVVAVSSTPPTVLPLDVGIIVPSPSNDLAFSQALVDALGVLNEERGGLTLNVSDNMFDVDMAREQAQEYANSGSDVVILHGAQFLEMVEPLAQASPDVIFVAGPGPFETDLPNVFVYTVAAEQGAYVLGDLAASLSESGTIGITGPVPAAEPKRFVEGFRIGAEQRGATVLAEYVGSFNDVDAASALAASQVAAGADVLTGTAQLVVGPVAVAEQEGLLWFANQANQTSLAPQNVVASQVYHFEVAIREILAEIDANAPTGGSFPLTLGNGGMLLEFNPNYPLSRELRDRADELLLDVTAGAITVNVDLE